MKYFNKKYLPLKTSKTKFKRKINNSQKVSMKILNVFFKPESTKSYKSIFTPNKSNCSHISLLTGIEFSPIPPVNTIISKPPSNK